MARVDATSGRLTTLPSSFSRARPPPTESTAVTIGTPIATAEPKASSITMTAMTMPITSLLCTGLRDSCWPS